ncbi:hypothetical protein BC937DRAFT_89566 [Endogone sp. FLAS-F59071]|nr:hypothetical protein BC937DRAFT_89566 [Endogone sp. FLAS-F59071]|eukprot:RUS17721.1 hypothetical protein BC937DRAFT_89566 [Endogone sp. FLAS-F59071]
MASRHQQAYDDVYGPTPKHHSSWTHELLAGAAAFAATKAYEDHVRKNGQPTSHVLAKELFAAFSAAAVDGLVESKGLDFVDKEKAKHAAKQHAHNIYEEDYQRQ